jgi:sigma-B regulation protein RsbU (phosphoserine phosphatase)
LFYGVFESASQTLRYVNAGHNPPFVLRQDGSVRWLEPGGAPVGMFAESDYAEGSLQLSPGDLVVAYTDGVIEAANRAGEEWGIEGLLQAASACQAQGLRGTEDMVQSIFRSMDDFSGGRQHDDATVLVLRAESWLPRRQ